MLAGVRYYCACCGFAIAAVVVTAETRLLLHPWLLERARFLAFVPISMVAVRCGRMPAVLAALLSLGLGAGHIVEAAVFLPSTGGIVILSDGLARSPRQAARTAEKFSLLIDGADGYAIVMLDPAGMRARIEERQDG